MSKGAKKTASSSQTSRTAHSGRLMVGLILCALALAAMSGLAGAASSNVSAAKISSARLTKKSFTVSQAGSVKLTYKFSRASSRFSYLITRKQGAGQRTVKRVVRNGNFRGSKKTTVKKLFARSRITVGSYRLRLAARFRARHSLLQGRQERSRRQPGHGRRSAPVNSVLPAISGTTVQGKTLTASQGSWKSSPGSYRYQWRRCDGSAPTARASPRDVEQLRPQLRRRRLDPARRS